MSASLTFIAIAIVVLAIVAVLAFWIGRDRAQNRLTPLAGLAFAFIVAGILFGDNRLVGYGLMGVGVILAVLDIFNRSRNK